jgi:hypothetical protein
MMSNVRFLISALLLPCLAALPPAEASPPDALFLSRATSHIAESIRSLANYACTETIDREQQSATSTGFVRIDLVRLEVANIGGKELFAWPGAKKFQDKPIGAFVPGGLIGDGSFTIFADDLFVNGVGSMTVHGLEQLQGLPAVRIDYVVRPTKKSAFRIATEGGSAALGYSGSWWADPDTLDLLRLDIDFNAIPSPLRLAKASVSIEYGTMKSGNREALMPQSSGIEFLYLSGAISRNGIEFARCREFTGQTSIVFDGEQSGGGDASGRANAEAPDEAHDTRGTTFVLPSGLTIPLRLQTPIHPDTARVGDEISAIVEDDVSDGHRVWLPRGSIAHGRIRRIEQRRKEGAPQKENGYALAGIEFSEAEVGHNTAEFAARLQSIRMSAAIEMNHVEREESSQVETGNDLDKNFRLKLFEYRQSFDREVPGVGYLYMTAEPFHIPGGLLMVWRTEPLRESDWR